MRERGGGFSPICAILWPAWAGSSTEVRLSSSGCRRALHSCVVVGAAGWPATCSSPRLQAGMAAGTIWLLDAENMAKWCILFFTRGSLLVPTLPPDSSPEIELRPLWGSIDVPPPLLLFRFVFQSLVRNFFSLSLSWGGACKTNEQQKSLLKIGRKGQERRKGERGALFVSVFYFCKQHTHTERERKGSTTTTTT